MHEHDDQDYATIIGLDIGDGESSLAYLTSSDGGDRTARATIYARKGTLERSIITALGRSEATGRPLIGEEAVSAGAIQFSVNFKNPPQPHITPNSFLFAEALLDEFFRDTRIPREECKVYVGHPTGWATDAVDAYKAQFRKFDVPVQLMPESHSALLHVRDRRAGGNPWRDVALVVDIGSSTTDCTLVEDMNVRNLAVGSTLGCRQIDQELAQRVKAGLKGKEFQDALALAGGPQLLLLVCRRAKEAHFAGKEPQRLMFRDEPVDPKFDPITDPAFNWIQVFGNDGIDEIVNAPNGWKKNFRDLLTEVRAEAGDKLPKLIVVSGGGSRMPFVRDVVREIFPDAGIEDDPEPSFSVARGLASNGRHRANITRFCNEVAEISQDPAIAAIVEDWVDHYVNEIKAELSRLNEADPAAAVELAKSLAEGSEDLIDRYRYLYYLNRAVSDALSARIAESCRRYGVEDHAETFDVQFPRLITDSLITMVSAGFDVGSINDSLMQSGLSAAREKGSKLTDHWKSRRAERKMRERQLRQLRENGFDVYRLVQSPSYNKWLLAGGAVAGAAAIAGGIWVLKNLKNQLSTVSTHLDIDSIKVQPEEIEELIISVREQVRDQLTCSAEEIGRFLA